MSERKFELHADHNAIYKKERIALQRIQVIMHHYIIVCILYAANGRSIRK